MRRSQRLINQACLEACASRDVDDFAVEVLINQGLGNKVPCYLYLPMLRPGFGVAITTSEIECMQNLRGHDLVTPLVYDDDMKQYVLRHPRNPHHCFPVSLNGDPLVEWGFPPRSLQDVRDRVHAWFEHPEFFRPDVCWSCPHCPDCPHEDALSYASTIAVSDSDSEEVVSIISTITIPSGSGSITSTEAYSGSEDSFSTLYAFRSEP